MGEENTKVTDDVEFADGGDDEFNPEEFASTLEDDSTNGTEAEQEPFAEADDDDGFLGDMPSSGANLADILGGDDEMPAETAKEEPKSASPELSSILGTDEYPVDEYSPVIEQSKKVADVRQIIEAESPATPEREIIPVELKGDVSSWLGDILDEGKQANKEDDYLVQSATDVAFFSNFDATRVPDEVKTPQEQEEETKEARRIIQRQGSDWAERRRRRSMQREEDRREADRRKLDRERLDRDYADRKREERMRPLTTATAPTPAPTASTSQNTETTAKGDKPATASAETPQEQPVAEPIQVHETEVKPDEKWEVQKVANKMPTEAEKKKRAKKKAKKKPAPTQKKEEDPVKKHIIFGIIICAVSLYLAVMANSAWVVNYYQKPAVTTTTTFGNKTQTTTTKGKEPSMFQCLFDAFSDEKIGIHPFPISPSVFGGTFFMFAFAGGVAYFFKWDNDRRRKEARVGHEHGKGRIATPSDVKKYQRKFMEWKGKEMGDYNMLFAQGIGLSLNNKKTNRSANVLVIGGTGTGKTFRYIKPNILQENSSQIITDPSGDLFSSFAPYLIKKGYTVYLFNVSDMGLSNHYNPLLNVYDADGNIDSQKVDVLVDLYMKNASQGKKEGGGDPFWEKSEKAFLTGVIFYVLENDAIPLRDKCFHTVLEKVQLARADESKKGADAETMLTKEIKKWQMEMEKAGRKIMCPLYYDTFLIAPQKTANTILITTAVDLQIFSNENVDRITRYNEQYPDLNINLDDIGSTQTYVFLGIPQSHQAYNFLIAMLYSQLYGRLYDLGERGFVGKWMLEEVVGIPKFNPFDSDEDAIAFQHDCAVWNTDEDNGNIKLIERDYINNQKIYLIRWMGRTDVEGWTPGTVYKMNNGIYKKSFVRERVEELIRKAPSMKLRENANKPELPIHINFLLDEFKNIGEIPNFLTILSTSRKYRIGSHAIIQDIAQIKTMYPDDEHQTLLANVDTTIFLGSILTDDKEAIQKMLGKTTIMQESTSVTKQGTTTSRTPTEVDLMSIDEISKINQGDNNDCIVIIRDITPFVKPKLNLLEHKRWGEVCACKGFDPEIYYLNNREPSLYKAVMKA